ncbi:MAG: peptide ABC transporter permease [Planctomycetota bacterium]|nr:MAG: peptide ABC transporter permease [Planctomycetota bacterium]
MVVYALRRLCQAVPVLLGVSLVVVLAAHLVPGSPGESFVGEKGTPEKIRELNEALGWYDPLPVQWVRYVWGALHGDLGRSFASRRPVVDELGERIPATVELALAAALIAVPLGIGAGVAAALAHRFPWSLLDHGLSALALAGISFPVFWLGLLLQIYVYPAQQRLGPLSVLEPVTGLYVLDAALAGDAALLADAALHLALPAVALATIPLAIIARMTRASMREVLAQDYIRTARAKGLGRVRVALRHALRNALVPVVTVSGVQLAALLGGAVLTETVFQWPGLGTYIVRAAQKKDLPALQGAVLVVAVVFVLANLAVDLAYAWLDPRIRAGGGGGPAAARGGGGAGGAR